MRQRNPSRRRPAPKKQWMQRLKDVPAHLEPEFQRACKAAGISPTERQLKKWNKRTGIAWATAHP